MCIINATLRILRMRRNTICFWGKRNVKFGGKNASGVNQSKADRAYVQQFLCFC